MFQVTFNIIGMMCPNSHHLFNTQRLSYCGLQLAILVIFRYLYVLCLVTSALLDYNMEVKFLICLIQLENDLIRIQLNEVLGFSYSNIRRHGNFVTL